MSAKKTDRGHDHAEAFCLMTYASKDGNTREVIWNSRDGVTPFIVSSRDGVEMQHIDWHNDIYAPDHKPQPGDRIFVDLTPERNADLARERAARYFADPTLVAIARDYYGDVDTMARALTAEFRSGSPALVEVPGGGS